MPSSAAAAAAPRPGSDPGAVAAPAPSIPVIPTEEEIAEHNLTHLPFRAWCEACLASRAQDTAHLSGGNASSFSSSGSQTIPRVEMDYFYLGARGEQEELTCLAICEKGSGAIAAAGSPAKGGKDAQYLVEFVLATL